MMLQMVNGARDSIRNWLEEESIQYNLVEDSQNDYHLKFWFSRGLQLHTIFKNHKITVSIDRQFSHAMINSFTTQKPHSHKLDLELHMQNARFVLLHADQANTQLFGMRIFKDIWDDSLTRTSFFDTAATVEHSYYIVEINERELARIN